MIGGLTKKTDERSCIIFSGTSGNLPDKTKYIYVDDTLNIKEKYFFPNDKLTFTSDNENVARVNDDGVVRAVGEGTAKITVKKESGYTATFEITATYKIDTIPPNLYERYNR